ncbi:MAG: bifunctional helix-turn-helix domain-containing protein/methylated-DNA--[protein]-cysteine S-methyltransferase, partial [Sedimenticolaceae bacterium]
SCRMPAADTRSGRVDPVEADETYSLIERAIVFLRAHRDGQPKLADLAAHIGLSPSHTQRLFSRWAGISPKRFLQFLSVEHAKQRMGQTGDLLGLALNTGLSGPGRLHDLFVSMEAMSPGEFKRAAADVRIRCGFGDTPFGRALIAFTSRGICHLSFVEPRCRESAAAMLQAMWPAATLEPDPAGSSALLARIFARLPATADSGLSLWVSGTNFQIQVWRALLQIPYAGLLSYGQLAALLGRPNAARAVGSAVASNRVAFLIPCHRVLRGSGDFGVYHWGPERKMAMCAWEVATAGTGQAG